jgi:hypothetical protein
VTRDGKPQRILVTGFPHSGTSILRKLIGNRGDVHDLPFEKRDIDEQELAEATKNVSTHVVVKFPLIPENLMTDFDDWLVVAMKHPCDVFGSMSARFATDDTTESRVRHSVQDWGIFADQWFRLSRKRPKGYIAVKYEDLFDQNFKTLRSVFAELELSFDESIVSSDRSDRIVEESVDTPREEPARLEGKQHRLFRHWQINQPFENQTNKSRAYLSEEPRSEIDRLRIFADI